MVHKIKKNISIFILNSSLLFANLFIFAKNTFAFIPDESSGQNLGTLKGLGPLGNPIIGPNDPGTSTFTKFISTMIGIMTIVGIIWFIFVLFSGAIAWLSSGGDKQKLQNAQKQITTGLTGLIIVLSAIFLAKIAGSIFGMDLLNIQELIGKLN